MQRSFKIIGGWLGVIAIVLSFSYCSEWPKYRFERVATEVGRSMPGARLISSAKSGDLASPASWFWPATTNWTFAVPDPMLSNRFYTLTLNYGETASEKQPLVFLIDADCVTREMIWYGLDEPESAFPARDFWGNPVVAPNGNTYRRRLWSRADPVLPEWLHAFCETDWAAERKAAASALEH
jgi:hypothetical protein